MSLIDIPDFDALETQLGPIGARLRAPIHSMELAAFADALQWTAVRVRVEGLAGLIGDPDLAARMRGAFGEVLTEGASEAALAGRPCSFDPHTSPAPKPGAG